MPLTADQAAFVSDCVESGRFPSAEAVVREAFDLLADQERRAEFARQEIRQAIAVGVADLDAGRSTDAETVFADWDAELAMLRRDG